jgi:FAD/FMN-containing dehydrogenase
MWPRRSGSPGATGWVLGRRDGLTSDHLLVAQIVLADGSLIACDATHVADLFWALRGAGGGEFGVVTALTFGTVTAPTVTCFRLAWAHTHTAVVLCAWQAWAPTGPDHVTAEIRLSVAHRAVVGAVAEGSAGNDGADLFGGHMPAITDPRDGDGGTAMGPP